MYATCLHCQRPLGANDAIEALPIGRRLAFDAANGRLWVVCRRCERWNLTPFESRWEALEACERAFRGTRVRVSTEQVGLARLPDGTDLVRIGRPLRPEFAAWRYGDQFGRRRRRAIAIGVGVSVGAGLAVAGVSALGAGVAVVMPMAHLLNFAVLFSRGVTMNGVFAHPDGGWFRAFGPPRLMQRPDVEEGWGIEIGSTARLATPRLTLRSPWREVLRHSRNHEMERVQLRGRDAESLLRRLLPLVNRAGASRTAVADGVRMIEEVGDPARFGAWAAGKRREWGALQIVGDTGDLSAIPAPARLAFEMAIHEDTERRALEGELAALETAWREADEVARIADALLVPEAVSARLDEMRNETADNRGRE